MARLDDEVSVALVDALRDRYGPQSAPDGGPIDRPEPFESIVEAGLNRVADPRKASAVVRALRDAGLLRAEALAALDPLEVEELLRASKIQLPVRSFRPIQRIARWAAERDFDREGPATWTTEALRDEWRGLNGIGPAMADALLLFGLGRPTYPLDRATYRVLIRHGWIDTSADYDEARAIVEAITPDDPETLARLSTDFEKLGRDYCKPTVARCDHCPLRPLLPPNGPIEAGD